MRRNFVWGGVLAALALVGLVAVLLVDGSGAEEFGAPGSVRRGPSLSPAGPTSNVREGRPIARDNQVPLARPSVPDAILIRAVGVRAKPIPALPIAICRRVEIRGEQRLVPVRYASPTNAIGELLVDTTDLINNYPETELWAVATGIFASEIATPVSDAAGVLFPAVELSVPPFGSLTVRVLPGLRFVSKRRKHQEIVVKVAGARGTTNSLSWNQASATELVMDELAHFPVVEAGVELEGSLNQVVYQGRMKKIHGPQEHGDSVSAEFQAPNPQLNGRLIDESATALARISGQITNGLTGTNRSVLVTFDTDGEGRLISTSYSRDLHSPAKERPETWLLEVDPRFGAFHPYRLDRGRTQHDEGLDLRDVQLRALGLMVSGSVLSMEGVPIEGASVSLSFLPAGPGVNWMQAPGVGGAVESESAANGAFTLFASREAGSYRLLCKAPGFLDTTMSIDSSMARDLVVSLSPAGRLRVEFLLADAGGLVYAELMLLGPGAVRAHRSQTQIPSGEVVLDGLAPGEYSLDLVLPHGQVASSIPHVSVVPGETADLGRIDLTGGLYRRALRIESEGTRPVGLAGVYSSESGGMLGSLLPGESITVIYSLSPDPVVQVRAAGFKSSSWFALTPDSEIQLVEIPGWANPLGPK